MGNAMLDRIHAAEQRGAQAGELFGQQFAIDLLQIALHRHGWGYERVRKLLDEMRALSDYYDPAFYPNPEQEVWQERMDAELRDLIKDKARCYTFAERHPIIPGVRWKRQKGVTPIEWKGEGNG